jgi:hypothetical protein
MDDENTTTPSDDTASDVSPKTAATPPAAKETVNESSVPATESLPPTPAEKPHENFHDVPHVHHKWHADVLVDGHDVYQGYVKNMSMKGVHLFLDHNLQNVKRVKLHIHIPPLITSEPHHVLEVTGDITSTVYDSDEESFRSGVNFREFTLKSDQAYLQSHLAD